MAIQFDASKATMFRNVNFGNENAIANLNDNGGLKAHGVRTLFCKFSRTDMQKAENNAVRTALLKALGQGFGIAGMHEEGGQVTFSQDFMARLEKILGSKVFKRGDFEVGDDGLVRSGKPLTQRRITSILTKATMAYRTNFDPEIYRTKLNIIKNELGLTGLEGDALNAKLNKNTYLNAFVLADRGLDFLQNQLFLEHKIVNPKTKELKTVYGPNNSQWDRSFMRVNPDYEDRKNNNVCTNDMDMYEIRIGDSKIYEPFTKPKRDAEIQKFMPGVVFHLENSEGHKHLTAADLEKDKKYLYNTTQLVVQKVVDLYFECKASGKLAAFKSLLTSGFGGCMEQKGKNLNGFEEANFKQDNIEEAKLDKAEIAELNRIADAPVGSPADKQIYSVIEELQTTDEKYKEMEDWKDFSGPVKERLLGKPAKIMTFTMDETRNQYKFEPLLDNRGNPVFRNLTEEDIDKMGPACLYNTLGY